MLLPTLWKRAALPLVLAAYAPRGERCGANGVRGSLFPDDAASSPPSTTSKPILSREACSGFWVIYDDLAVSDCLNEMAAGSEPTSMLSASIVLRVDGQTSRGSDFPGGTWTVEQQPMAVDGTPGRWRVSIVLQSRLLRQELRYEGLLLGLQVDTLPTANAVGQPLKQSSGAAGDGAVELRVVGQATRWDVSDTANPVQMSQGGFSMIKQQVDRRKLTPMIKPLEGATVDPEEVRMQQEWRKLKEQSEEDDLRRAIAEVREAKAANPTGWRQDLELREGTDYWHVGAEPNAELEDEVGADSGEESQPLQQRDDDETGPETD